MEPEIEPFLTVAQVANKLNRSEKTICRRINARKLRAHKEGAEWRIRPEDLAAYMRRCRFGDWPDGDDSPEEDGGGQ